MQRRVGYGWYCIVLCDTGVITTWLISIRGLAGERIDMDMYF